MVNVAIVGFGYAARTFHAPLVSSTPGLALKAIVQPRGDTARSSYHGIEIILSLNQLLERADIDLVVIATPNPSHYELAKKCLIAGKHVVVDKPIATSAAQAGELAGVATSAGKILSVFQNRRWDGDFLTLQSLLAEGAFGRVVRVESNFDRYRPAVDAAAWRQRSEPGSGVLFDLAPHLFDQALQAFGVPAQLTASVCRQRTNAVVDDAFDVVFEYASGLRFCAGASMLACAPRPRFSVSGSAAAWIKHGLDPQEAALKRGEVPGVKRGDSPLPVENAWGADDPTQYGELVRCVDGSATRNAVPTLHGDYPAYYRNLRDAIAGIATLAVTPLQAVHTMQLIELSLDSSRQHRTLPVTLATGV